MTLYSKAVQEYKAPIINHKVEQVVRAIYWGFETHKQHATSILHTSALQGSAITYSAPDDHLAIGIADSRGYRFKPETNSALITLGYHPTAVLLHLTRMRLDGEPVVRAVGDELIAIHAAVVQCARDVVFNWEIVQQSKVYNKKTGKHVPTLTVIDKPILREYLTNGKPPLFT